MAAEQSEILQVTVGKATFLSGEKYQNTASVAVSRTGVVAAFYPKPEMGPKFYRTSTDGGTTWGEEREFSPKNAGRMSIALRDGGVLFMVGATDPVKGGNPGDLKATREVFSDDFAHYEVGTASVSIPKAALNTRWAQFWPVFDKGKIVQLTNGALLAVMYGNFTGDAQYRTLIVRSTDSGKTWQYHATVAYDPNDPNPELVGAYAGYCEPSLALLSNGELLCVMRTQGAQFAGEYRPLYLCWSKDLGKTWTRPIPTKPELMNISPTLAVLDNGVLACQYGRPGFHVAFSLDQGRTWQDRITFSDLPEPFITGQFDMVKVGSDRLVAIGSDAEGTKVWPITVKRAKASLSQLVLEGSVLDQQGNPIAGARVERSPNRYPLDSWLEDGTKLDPWNATPLTIGSPELGYRSIRKENGYSTVQTDAQGHFRFEPVELGEYVLTVESDGYAPQSGNIKAGPASKAHEFRLKSGRKILGRIVDQAGKPVTGACVVLNTWHIHSDSDGFFHGAIDAPVPSEVTVKVYKRYHGDYLTFEEKLSLLQMAEQPIVLRPAK